jgi:3-dehydro-L-gulonate 2-dehydrogenase
MERISFDTLHAEFRRILLNLGFSQDRGDRCARLFAQNTCDGVVSHGLNRFPGFVRSCQAGTVDIEATPELAARLGTIEQFDGNSGVGLLNAQFAMARAVEIAREHGMGCVGLKNTNHWMRAGSYGLQACEAGCIALCWTNTTALMPPWGSAQKRIGNNPLTLCVPHKNGHVLLDMAMSQYSNGKLEVMRRRGEKLTLAGGYDEDGELTTDPGAIVDSRRALPIGYWKGSGLALVLDLLATIISGGDSTAVIRQRDGESNVSQVFIAIDALSLSGAQILEETVEQILSDYCDVEALEGAQIRYPGQGMLATRRDNLANGISVDEELWREIQQM